MSEMSEIIKTCDNCGYRSCSSSFSTRGVVVCHGPKECENYSHWKPDLQMLETENATLKSDLEKAHSSYQLLERQYTALRYATEETALALSFAVEDLRRETGEKSAGPLMEKYKSRAAKAFEEARLP